MASLATVCGLGEQEVIDMQSETISALKSLNDYFYSPVSTSCQRQSSLGNFNQWLQKPQTGDGSRSVKICLEYTVNLKINERTASNKRILGLNIIYSTRNSIV